MDDYPHPAVDAKGFVKAIKAANHKEPKVWNPVTGKKTDWVDVNNMKDIVGGKCVIM